MGRAPRQVKSYIYWAITPLKVNGPHGVIAQKTGLFITTAVRTLNPTSHKMIDYLR
jgi:hypothetical protein